MSTSSLTGTQKKALKQEIKDKKFFTEQAKKDLIRQRPFTREARRDIQAISKGKNLPSYQKQTLEDLLNDFKRAGKGAEKIFAPIKEAAVANFDQYTAPEVVNQYGRESGSGSSALNQAMAAARGNLQRSLAADFAGLQSNLASNLLGQREQSRQFANQSQLANINARLQGSGALLGQPINPQFTGLGSANPYMQSNNRGPSGFQSLLGAGLQAAGTIAGGMFAGPAGAVAGNRAASWGTNQL